MYRWTPRDTCYHFAPLGIFIASANEPMVIDRDARQPVTTTTLKPIPARNFQTNEIQLLVEEPSILLAGTSRRLFRRGSALGYSNETRSD